MILAGGTGGHVFPALAVANELREHGIPVVWVGTERGIEAKVVPNAGFELIKMSVQGLRRKGITQYMRAPFIIIRALWESMRILLRYKPKVLLGMGGFVAGPCALMGFIMRKPIIIHEQNAVVGLTNRILAPFSKVMFTGFPLKDKYKKTRYVGNPVRKELLNIVGPTERFAGRVGNKRILVIGGSQGSTALNNTVPEAIHLLKDSLSIDVWHQTGTNAIDDVTKQYEQMQTPANVAAFIEDMSQAYAWADLVVCRSGAMTLAELAMVGVGSILVPYPYAVDDHQTANAKTLVIANAAYLIAEHELTASCLATLLQKILSDSEKTKKMAVAARDTIENNATTIVAQTCMQLAGYKLASMASHENS